MSRTRKAGTLAIFGYMQFGLSFVSGIVLIPLILKLIGTQSYGLWLACGDLLAYSAMVDLGVLNVLPWIIAEKDGQNDRGAIGKLIGGGLIISIIIGFFYFIIAMALWHFAATVVNLNASQRETLAGPLFFLIASTAICFPLRTFSCVILGLQDVLFSGILGIAQWALNIFLLLFLLLRGYGLYALSVSAVLPTLIVSLACLVRVKWIAPDLLKNWARPSLRGLFSLMKEGLGAWLGNFGWRLAAASNSIIIVTIGSPEMAVAYACTAKMGEILMQMSWQLSDSGLLGLAQLSGEGKIERVREVILSMMRLLLITSGGVAIIIVMINPHFVSLWVGQEKFGGYALNILLAVGIIGLSLTHGLIVPTSVLGSRLEAGLLTLVQGIVYAALAILLGHFWGLAGIGAAGAIVTFLLAIPVGMKLLQRRVNILPLDLWRHALIPWLDKIVFPLAAGIAFGTLIPLKTIWPLIPAAPALGLIYLWGVRSMYVGLPVPIKIKAWLERLRLVPQQ